MKNIFVFSGNDIVSSRKAFLEHLEGLERDSFEVERINGKDLTSEFLELLSSPVSLFGEKKALIIENFLAGAKSKEKDKIIRRIVSLLDCSIVIWESKDISKAEQLKYPKNFIFKNFKLPASLFIFLDQLLPNNSIGNLKYLTIALETVDPNFLFLMLIRQIRLLILAKDSNDLLKLAPWQKSKLQKQAKGFSEEKLIQIYQKLLEIDFNQKTSNSPFSLEHELELLISDV